MIYILDPRNILCFGVCSYLPAQQFVSLNIYSRNNPYAGFVEFVPDISLGYDFAGAYVSISAFNGRSRAGSPDWNPYREYSLEVVDWNEEPVIGKKPLFEVLQYRAFGWIGNDKINVKVGRDYIKVGRALRYPLFLSGWGYPLDWYYFARGSFGIFRGFTGFARVPSKYENKRLAFQRMEVDAGFLSVGISEMVVYTRSDQWKYANPFVLYYVVQRRESDNDDNLFLYVDLSMDFGFMEIFGEFIGDDPSVFHGEGQAPLMGLTGGVRLDGNKWFANLEVSAVLPFTYAHFTEKNTLESLGLPLATYLGQDYIALYGYASYGFLFFDLEYIVHGKVPFGLAFENSGLPPNGDFPRKPRDLWIRVGIGIQPYRVKFGDIYAGISGRAGTDIINGRVSPSWSLLWMLNLRWGI